MSRRASVTGLMSGPKSQRTSKLVELSSAPLADVSDGLALGHEADGGVREYKSQAERMYKEQRKEAGFKRITAYCVAESFKIKLLSSFLKREHNISPRAFDEALYVVNVLLATIAGMWSQRQYSLLGTSKDSHISPGLKKTSTKEHISHRKPNNPQRTVTPSGLPPPAETNEENDPGFVTDPGFATEPDVGFAAEPVPEPETPVSEIIPGVVPTPYEVNPGAETDPGVYSRWKEPEHTEEPAKQRDILDIDHALAQSTLLLAVSGALKLCRHDAPSSQADCSNCGGILKDLYDAVREYIEIGPRVQVLNEKLGVASDFLDAIHDHLNNSAMERITWIVFWLIVVACLVALGEVVVGVIFPAATTGTNMEALASASASALPQISRKEMFKVLERLMVVQSQSQS
ncbi:hypothetical protein CVT25_014463 [Psilocybe cyanescens]|uniref:Uncharacterized protein n=1 Tax=Psilocybe cyanescens TaxID=93625 RepID=A0A409XRJ5_PSICY|nr:hypothetical protein CVT25_014463 [Psilocybe cyanescens]